MRAIFPVQLILLDLINIIIFDEEYCGSSLKCVRSIIWNLADRIEIASDSDEIVMPSTQNQSRLLVEILSFKELNG
jgi:hypothetical protein